MFVAEVLAITTALVQVRYFFNVCTSPANQLELVMEAIQVRFKKSDWICSLTDLVRLV